MKPITPWSWTLVRVVREISSLLTNGKAKDEVGEDKGFDKGDFGEGECEDEAIIIDEDNLSNLSKRVGSSTLERQVKKH